VDHGWLLAPQVTAPLGGMIARLANRRDGPDEQMSEYQQRFSAPWKRCHGSGPAGLRYYSCIRKELLSADFCSPARLFASAD
jgi:hypothetical protein